MIDLLEQLRETLSARLDDATENMELECGDSSIDEGSVKAYTIAIGDIDELLSVYDSEFSEEKDLEFDE